MKLEKPFEKKLENKELKGSEGGKEKNQSKYDRYLGGYFKSVMTNDNAIKNTENLLKSKKVAELLFNYQFNYEDVTYSCLMQALLINEFTDILFALSIWLGAFFHSEEWKKASLIEKNAVECAIQLLSIKVDSRTYCDYFLLGAMSMLVSLENEKKCKAIPVQDEVLEDLVGCLKSKNNDIVANAESILGDLVKYEKGCVAILKQRGLVERLCELVDSNNAGIQGNAAKILVSLNKKEEGRKKLSEFGLEITCSNTFEIKLNKYRMRAAGNKINTTSNFFNPPKTKPQSKSTDEMKAGNDGKKIPAGASPQ